MPEPTTYRAFLSYSHADSAVAARVHHRLETFHIDKDLAGRPTPRGPVPDTLRPIFRDRAEFEPGKSLPHQTREALDRSEALILLASPHAAASHYVNEEVRLFRWLYPGRLVIPLIAETSPAATPDLVFPPALRFDIEPTGTIGSVPTSLLAADEREEGDGRDLALSKIVAALIGVPPDDVFRRAERERRRVEAERRQARNRKIAAAVIAALALGGGTATWMFFRENTARVEVQRELLDAKALALKLLSANPARAQAPGEAESLAKTIEAIAAGATTDDRYAQALALLKQGKTAEAAALLEASAKDAEATAVANNKRAAASYRQLAAIAAIANPKKARDAYAQAARLDPDDVEGLFRHGDAQMDAGNLAEAETAYRRVAAIGQPGKDDFSLYWAQLGLGDIAIARGALPTARAAYDQAATIAARALKPAPGNAGWRRDLSISHNKIGDVLVAQGKLAEALAAFREAMAIAESLAKADPGNAGWRRDLAVSHIKIGAAQSQTGDEPAAEASFRAALGVLDGMAAAGMHLDPAAASVREKLAAMFVTAPAPARPK